MECSDFVSSTRRESSMTLYWKPSTWITANCWLDWGGYSMPRAGLWTRYFTYLGARTIALIDGMVRLFIVGVVICVVFFFICVIGVFSNDRPWCSRDIFFGVAEWTEPLILNGLAFRRTLKIELGRLISTLRGSEENRRLWCKKGQDFKTSKHIKYSCSEQLPL